MRKLFLTLILNLSVTFSYTQIITFTSISYKIPLTINLEQNTVFSSSDTLKIIVLGNDYIYKLPENRDIATDSTLHNSESYFICNKGATMGVYYKNNFPSKIGYTKSEVKVDSFLALHAFGSTKMEEQPIEFYKKESKTIGDTLINTFLLLDTTKLDFYDTIIYKFRHYDKEIGLNVAKRMDSVYNKSLFYFSFTHRQKYWPSEKLIIPQHGLKVEIEEKEMSEAESENFKEFIHNLKKNN